MKNKLTADDAASLALSIGNEHGPLVEKYGMITGSCDGFGNIILDNVPAGSYFALIVSKQTRRNTHLPAVNEPFAGSVRLFMADDQALLNFVGFLPDHPTDLTLHKWAIESVKVTAGQTAHFGHDFGNTDH